MADGEWLTGNGSWLMVDGERSSLSRQWRLVSRIPRTVNHPPLTIAHQPSTLNHRRAGYLLLELIITIGVYSVMLTLALQLYISLYKNLERQQTQSNLLVASRELMHQFRHDVRNARRILPNWRHWRSGSHTLILELPAASHQDSWGRRGGAWVVYQAQPANQQVMRYFMPSGEGRSQPRSYAEPLGRGIQQVSFVINRRSGAPPLVEMKLSHRRLVHRRSVNLNLRTAAMLRNGGFP